MRLYYVLPVCLALAGSVVWSALPQRTAPTIIAPEGDDVAVERILTALAEPAVGWEFMEAPLPEFARWLKRELELPVRIDEAALRAAKIEPTTPITAQLPRSPRDVALSRTLHRYELAWDIVDGELLITTPDRVLPRTYTRLYAVKSLVQLRDKRGAYDDGEALVSTVTSCVDPDEWEDNGAGTATAQFMPATYCLAVSAPFATQQKVARLLDSLRTLRDEQGGGITYYPRRVILSAGNGAW